jgi:hypothetical protein
MKVGQGPRRSVAFSGLAAAGSLVAVMGAMVIGASPAFADITAPASGGTVDTASPVTSGTGETDGNNVLVSARNADGMEVLGRATVAEGAWNCTFISPVPAGVWTTNAQETSQDPANVSDTPVANVTIVYAGSRPTPTTPATHATPTPDPTTSPEDDEDDEDDEADESDESESESPDPSASATAADPSAPHSIKDSAEDSTEDSTEDSEDSEDSDEVDAPETTPSTALPVTAASDPTPYVMSGLALLTVGAAAVLWRVRVRVRRANRE